MATSDEFRDLAIARDLIRKPQVRLLALTLWQIYTDDPKDKDNIPPIFVRMAHRIISEPEHLRHLNIVLEVVL